jgi:hypothetical protein
MDRVAMLHMQTAWIANILLRQILESVLMFICLDAIFIIIRFLKQSNVDAYINLWLVSIVLCFIILSMSIKAAWELSGLLRSPA